MPQWFPVQTLFLFLSIGAVSLFSFISIAHWLDSRRKEREAYYKHESLRRIAEMPGENAAQVIEMMREEERRKLLRRREGLKLGGIINVGVGIALCVFLYSLGGIESPWLCGTIPGLIGVAMLVYVFWLAPKVE
jgi:hypothetical protein